MKKVILGFIIGIAVCGVVGVSAYTLLARDISYKDTNVEDAIDDLYDKTHFSESVLSSGLVQFNGTPGVFWTPTVDVEAGVNHVVMYVTVTSTYGDAAPTVSGSIISTSSVTLAANPSLSGVTGAGMYKIDVETTGEAGTLNISVSAGGNNSKNTATMVVIKSNR